MTNKLLLIVIVLQLIIAGEIALTADLPNPKDAVCNVIGDVVPLPFCEPETKTGDNDD